MLRRETVKKRSIYWTYIDRFLTEFAAQHTGKAAFEQMMIRPKHLCPAKCLKIRIAMGRCFSETRVGFGFIKRVLHSVKECMKQF